MAKSKLSRLLDNRAEYTAISHDTVFHRVVRALVKPLARLGVTPNQITAARLVTGLAGAVIYAVDLTGAAFAGSALVVLSMALDRLDGELARAAGLTSKWGHTFDLLSDAAVNAAIFSGLGIGLFETIGAWGPALGIIASIGVVGALTIVMRLEALHGARAGELKSGGFVDPDGAMIIAPITVVLGGSVALVVTAAVVAPLAAIALAWHFRSELQVSRS